MRKTYNLISLIVIVAFSSFLFAQNSRMGSASSTLLLVVPSAKYFLVEELLLLQLEWMQWFWNPTLSNK